jgi:hypothetical protein
MKENTMDRNDYSSKSQMNVRRKLIAVSCLYLVNASFGVLIAIQNNLPSVTLFKSGKPALEDFLIGYGTALSPPLVLCIATILLIILSFRPKRLGTFATLGLLLLGVLFLLGELAETITYRALNPATFDLPIALVKSTAIVLALLMITFGIQVFVSIRHNITRQ